MDDQAHPRKKDAPSAEDSENRYNAARELLGGTPAGGSVDVVRLKPGWCKGWLDKIEVSPDDQIELDDIRDEYGGKKLQLIAYGIPFTGENGKKSKNYLGSRIVFFPNEPRKDGRPLRWEDSDESRAMERATKPTEDSGIASMMKMFMEGQSQMFDRFTGMMETQLKSAQKPANAPQTAVGEAPDPIEQLDKIGDTIERLEDLRGKLGGGAESAMDSSIGKGVDALITIFVAKQKHQMDLELKKIEGAARPDLPERAAATTQQAQATQPAAAAPSEQKPTAVPDSEEEEEETDTSAHEAISELAKAAGMPAPTMDDVQLIMSIHQRMETMDPGEQKAAIEAVMGMASPGVLDTVGTDDDPNGSPSKIVIDIEGAAGPGEDESGSGKA